MTEPVSRAEVEAFYEAYRSRDPQRIAEFLDDDVEWHIGGPVDSDAGLRAFGAARPR